MFEDLRRAFREAVDNFKEELNREDVGENVDRLLKGMIDEVTSAKARLAGLEEDIDTTGKYLESHNKELETTRRREGMAREIGDEETAQVAAEYAAKVEAKVGILERKLAALTEEATYLRREVDGMMSQIKEARTRRDGLTAEAGRTGARESLGASKDLFDDFARMESSIEGEEADVDAWSEVSEATSEHRIDLDEPPSRDIVDFDARLEELKRRMNDD